MHNHAAIAKIFLKKSIKDLSFENYPHLEVPQVVQIRQPSW